MFSLISLPQTASFFLPKPNKVPSSDECAGIDPRNALYNGANKDDDGTSRDAFTAAKKISQVRGCETQLLAG